MGVNYFIPFALHFFLNLRGIGQKQHIQYVIVWQMSTRAGLLNIEYRQFVPIN